MTTGSPDGFIDAAKAGQRDDSDACATCVHWNRTAAYDAWGQCRRLPPLPDFSTPRAIGVWPATRSSDYCGEHKP